MLFLLAHPFTEFAHQFGMQSPAQVVLLAARVVPQMLSVFRLDQFQDHSVDFLLDLIRAINCQLDTLRYAFSGFYLVALCNQIQYFKSLRFVLFFLLLECLQIFIRFPELVLKKKVNRFKVRLLIQIWVKLVGNPFV